jgi:hypothetical protein
MRKTRQERMKEKKKTALQNQFNEAFAKFAGCAVGKAVSGVIIFFWENYFGS